MPLDNNGLGTMKEPTPYQDEASMKPVLAAITSNFVVTTLKFIGWFINFSPSMLAEAIHSLADTANQVLLYVGIRHGAGKPTKQYPFGKGQARYIWNLVSAMGIFFVGFGFTTYHGIHSLIAALEARQGYTEPSATQLVILVISLLLEGWSLVVALKSINEAKEDKTTLEYIKTGDDPTSVAVLLEDSIAVLGVLVALLGLWASKILNTPVPDAIAAIFVGILLGTMAILLAIANGRILMGISAGSDIESEIREFVEAYPSVERITSLKTAVLAPGRMRVAIEVEFHGGILINRQQIERDAERIREGEDPTYILFETAERMVRTVGREINRLEADIHKKFPDIVVIDLEVN